MKQMLDLALSNVQISVTELHANLMNASFAYLKYLYLFQKTCNTKQLPQCTVINELGKYDDTLVTFCVNSA